jgi:flagellar assembly protein FliH
VLSYKNVYFEHPLREVTLAYSGRPKVAEEQARQMEREAYIRGREEATNELNQQILHNRREVHQLLGETLETLDVKVSDCLKDIFREIPDLVIRIASQVLGRLDLDAVTIRAIVDDVLGDLPTGKHPIDVFLSPRDLDVFRSYSDSLENDYPGIHFKDDPRLVSGDCRVESLFGTIDARIETKLRHVREQLNA